MARRKSCANCGHQKTFHLKYRCGRCEVLGTQCIGYQEIGVRCVEF